LRAQGVLVLAANEPLPDVLFGLKMKHDLQFSFNDELLKACLITDSTLYKSVEHMLDQLLQNCGLDYKISKGVIIIFEANIKAFFGLIELFANRGLLGLGKMQFFGGF